MAGVSSSVLSEVIRQVESVGDRLIRSFHRCDSHLLLWLP